MVGKRGGAHPGMLQCLDYEDTRTPARNEAVAIPVEGRDGC
jgi:hypothetical protein